MHSKYVPWLIVAGVLLLWQRSSAAAQNQNPGSTDQWLGGPGGATGTPGQTANGDPLIPGWNAPPIADPSNPGFYDPSSGGGGGAVGTGQLGSTTGPVTLTQ